MTEKKLNQAIKALKDGLLSIYLYQKDGVYIPVFIVKKIDFVLLDKTRDIFSREKFIILTEDDIFSGTDVFCLKFLDIKNHSTVFYGDDVLKTLDIPLSDLRSSLELEIRNKLIQLREGYLSLSRGRDFLRHILPGLQLIREGGLQLKHPGLGIPSDHISLLSLFDVAWSCNSQMFYYLVDDRIQERKIPQLIQDIHQYLSELCLKVNAFIL